MTTVFMTEEDQNINANEFLDLCEEEKFFKLRTRIEKLRKSSPVALCSVCFQPVVLRATSNRTKFFAHVKDSEDCPIKTTTNLTQEEILAMKYNGQKEGRLHKENKQHISELLRLDPQFNDDVMVEKTFREKHPTGIAKKWRRPDISAKLKAEKRQIVFEIQVSTTFLDVIIGREQFYKDNEAYITWVFLDFDPDKFTLLDIAYANKANVFVFDKEAKYESEQNNCLILKCYYRKPYMSDDFNIAYQWTAQLIDFSYLSFDSDTKKPFLIDTEMLKTNVISQIRDEKMKLKHEQEEEARRAREKERLNREAEQRKRDEQQFEMLQRSHSSVQTPRSYRSKAHRGKTLSTPILEKLLSSSLVCRKCHNIGKPKKLGRITVCSMCGHEIS